MLAASENATLRCVPTRLVENTGPYEAYPALATVVEPGTTHRLVVHMLAAQHIHMIAGTHCMLSAAVPKQAVSAVNFVPLRQPHALGPFKPDWDAAVLVRPGAIENIPFFGAAFAMHVHEVPV